MGYGLLLAVDPAKMLRTTRAVEKFRGTLGPCEVTVQDGPSELALMDAENMCAFARFCDPHGHVWSQIERTDGTVATAAP
jgi:hypothetical protein